jgi:Cytidylate kinase-like family
MERGPRSVNEMVEHQVRRWLAEQQRRAQERRLPERPRPVITVSREAGARGTELGRRVADRLGFHLWDQELVQQIAEQVGAPELPFRAVDEQARNAIQDLLAGILMGDAFTEKGYLAQLVRVLHAIAHQGSAVIIGRGAQFVLSHESTLRLRVVGAIDTRVRNVASVRGLSEREARAEVQRIDRERLTFVRHHFHNDAADLSAYDLVVNSTTIPFDRAVDVVVSAYRARFERAPHEGRTGDAALHGGLE